jgi:uncharacterized protein
MLTKDEIEELCASSADKVERLRALLHRFDSALVAFSGGVDSAFILKMCVEQLGDKVVALTALSPSVAPEEAEEAQALATAMGARHIMLPSNELANPSYVQNGANRCYFCKSELYGICEQKRVEWGLAVVFDGFNADDRRDFRPGHKAAREFRVSSPLAEVALTKREIRAWSARLNLPTWDKPQMACLASRLPYGTLVTAERLQKVGAAESALRQLGLRAFRVRYHHEVARLEVSQEEYARFSEADFRQSANDALQRLGFAFVALDLEPFRSGRMNDALASSKVALPVMPS